MWGPNLVLLVTKDRPIQRSLAFLCGRALVLTVASIFIVSGLLGRAVGAGKVETFARSFTTTPQPAQDVIVGLLLIGAGIWFWRRPPAFVAGRSVAESASDVGRARLWASFALGVGVLLANLLEFAWQGLAFTALFSRDRSVTTAVLGVVVWSVVGTADVWVPLGLRGIGGKRAKARIEKLTASLPDVQPWQVALPLAVLGLGFLALGLYRALA